VAGIAKQAPSKASFARKMFISLPPHQRALKVEENDHWNPRPLFGKTGHHAERVIVKIADRSVGGRPSGE
jgi:hypothetical protein